MTSGSATITFRKLLDSGIISDEAIHEVLSYAVDVDWVEAYLARKGSESYVWSQTLTHGAPLAQRLLHTFVDLVAEPDTTHSVSRMLNSLDTIGAVLRAILKRPSPDPNLTTLQLICGPTLNETALLRLVVTLTSVLSAKDRVPPVAKGSALGSLLLLTSAAANVHQNVLVDYVCMRADAVFIGIMDVLREPSLVRSVSNDALLLLVLLCNYQRQERRNPFLSRVRGVGLDAVYGRVRHDSTDFGSVVGDDEYDGESSPHIGASSSRPGLIGSHSSLTSHRFLAPTPSLPHAEDDKRYSSGGSSAPPTPVKQDGGVLWPAHRGVGSVITSSTQSASLEYQHCVIRSLQGLTSNCNAQLAQLSQVPLLSKLEGKTAEEAAHVVTPASLVLRAGSGAASSSGSGWFSYVTGAVTGLATLASSLAGVAGSVSSGGSGAKPADPLLVTCMGHIGSHCPPNDSLRSPLRLPFATRAAVLLMAFHDAACASVEAAWMCAGGYTWRGHAGGLPLPSSAPELIRQVLSLCSFALQANEKELPRLALIILTRMVEANPPNNAAATAKELARSDTPGLHSDGVSPISHGTDDSAAASQQYQRAMHTLMFSRTLDADSTQLVLYERGGDGGFVAVKCSALPLTVGIVKMVCHAINVRLKGKLNTAVLSRCLKVLHRILYHCVHDPSASADRSSVRGVGLEWVQFVRCIIALSKRLVTECSKTSSYSDDVKDVVFETGRVLDLALTGFADKARVDVYYEFIRERNVLEGFRTAIMRVFAPEDVIIPEALVGLPKVTLDRLFGALPPRMALAARNLHVIVMHLGDHISRAAAALRAVGDAILTEEDVIKMVTEECPWKHVAPADRYHDSYVPYCEGGAGDAAVFVALTRGIVEDTRASLKLV